LNLVFHPERRFEMELRSFPPEWLCVRCIPFADKGVQRTEALAENCLRFSPMVVFPREDAIYLEISQVRHLLSRASMKFRIRVLAKRLGVQVVTIADHEDPAWAWVMSQRPEYARMEKKEAPLSVLAEYARAFRAEGGREDAALAEMVQKFEKLGLKTLGDLMAISPGELNARFSREVRGVLEKLCGVRASPLVPYRPPEEIFEFEEFPLETPCIRMDGVYDRVQRMLQRLSARLHARRLWIENLEVRLHFSSCSHLEEPFRAFRIHLFHPMGGAMHLFEVIRNQLDFQTQTRKRLGAPVSRVEIFVHRTTRSRQQQADFFCKKVETEENTRILENKVRALVGDDNGFYPHPVASHLPERSWQRELAPLKEFSRQEAPIPPAERPSRIFPIPRQIEIDAQGRVHGLARVAYQVLRWQGPERILREWWRGWGAEEGACFAGRSRDYFKVKVAAVGADFGEVHFWIFQDERRKFFVHGCFD